MLKVHNTTIELIEGDLTALEVDAIVNAANGRLQHAGGLAAAISRAGGPAIREESDAWVKQHGIVPTGKCALTSGGNLKARFVIHAVGPVYDGSVRCAQWLASAVRSALEMADAQGLKSIALPAISTGIFGYPAGEAATVIVDATVSTLEAGTGLERVVFCLFGEEHFRIFERELARRA